MALEITTTSARSHSRIPGSRPRSSFDRPERMNLEEPQELLIGAFSEALAPAGDPGVADEHVHLAEVCVYRLEHPGDCLGSSTGAR
jgi:hypothetical protein